MKSNLVHVPLEPYRMRYTEFLSAWEQEAFAPHFDVTTLTPADFSGLLNIQTGEVLDSVNRPVWAMAQIKDLLLRPLPDLGKVYFSDFFHPGLEALPYSRRSFEAYAFLWAQSFDQYDFTRNMVNWMRPWEVMAFEIYSKVFVACPLLKELIVTALPFSAEKIEVVGLPFNPEHVGRQFDPAYSVEPVDCVYSSRWDIEKNPGVFLDVVQSCPELNFAVCTGWDTVRGSARSSIDRLTHMQSRLSNLRVHTNLTKGQYYSVLMNSRVQFNSAMQDWVSFTLLEALTYGCWPLYPNFRSFPMELGYNSDLLYRPGDAEDAARKLRRLVTLGKNRSAGSKALLDYHAGTLTRIAELIK